MLALPDAILVVKDVALDIHFTPALILTVQRSRNGVMSAFLAFDPFFLFVPSKTLLTVWIVCCRGSAVTSGDPGWMALDRRKNASPQILLFY
jgi:hypothetical protein